MSNTGLIFENYSDYIKENSEDLHSPQGIYRLISDESAFNEFKSALSEGLDDSAFKVVDGVLDRQRTSLIEEASNVAPGAFTHK